MQLLNCSANLCLCVFFTGLSDPEAREQSLLTLLHSLPPVNFKTAVFLFKHLRKYVASTNNYYVQCLACMMILDVCVCITEGLCPVPVSLYYSGET